MTMPPTAPKGSSSIRGAYIQDPDFTLYNGDALEVLKTLPDESVHCCVTSPPYWGLRDYGSEGQVGLEPTPDAYIAKMVEVFREVRRVLRKDGTCWLNIGDSYAGSWGAQSRGNTTGEAKSRIELFARRQRLGWDTWGNQALEHVAIVPPEAA